MSAEASVIDNLSPEALQQFLANVEILANEPQADLPERVTDVFGNPVQAVAAVSVAAGSLLGLTGLANPTPASATEAIPAPTVVTSEAPATVAPPAPELSTARVGDGYWSMLARDTKLTDAQKVIAIPLVQAVNNQTANHVIHPNDQLNIKFLNGEPAQTTQTSGNTTRVETTLYTVQKNDTSWDIANRNGISVNQLASDNGLSNPSLINPGFVMKINKVVPIALEPAPATVEAPHQPVTPNTAQTQVDKPLSKEARRLMKEYKSPLSDAVVTGKATAGVMKVPKGATKKEIVDILVEKTGLNRKDVEQGIDEMNDLNASKAHKKLPEYLVIPVSPAVVEEVTPQITQEHLTQKPAPAPTTTTTDAPVTTSTTAPEHTKPHDNTPPLPEGESMSWHVDKKLSVSQVAVVVGAIHKVSPEVATKWIEKANKHQDLNNLAEHAVLRLPGVSKAEWDKTWHDIKQLSETIKHNEALAAEVSPQGLMKQILSNPNITIGDSEGDQVRKSMQDIADGGKTFAHDLSQEGTKNIDVSPRLLQMILYLVNEKGHKITIGSMTTGNHVSNSNHFMGLAFDIDDDADKAEVERLYRDIYDAREIFEINELIHADPPEGTTGLRHGEAFTFTGATKENHRTHIHVSTLSREPIVPQEAPAPPQAPTPPQTVAPTPEKGAQVALTPEKISIIDNLPIEQWKKDNIKTILPLIMEYSTTNDTVTLAQWWVESNAGHDCPGNNCSGMKPDGYWHGETQTFMTFEYYNGVRKEEPHVFKKYTSLKDWIIDHNELILRAPHYRDAVAAKDNWPAYLRALVNPGEPAYATAPNYVPVLTDVIESNHLEELTK